MTGAAHIPHTPTVGDYMKNALFCVESAACNIRTLYDVGVLDTADILDTAENLAVMIRRWLEENN